MRKRWRFGISIILFVTLVLVIVFYRDYFYVNVITPIVQVLWPFIRTLLVINQKTYWGTLIVAATILIIWLISKEKEEDYKSAYYEPVFMDDPILNWENLFRRARKDLAERNILENKLEYLANSIEVCFNGSKPIEVHLPKNKPNLWKQLMEKRKHYTESNNNSILQDSDFDYQLNNILVSMETKLEIYHDNES